MTKIIWAAMFAWTMASAAWAGNVRDFKRCVDARMRRAPGPAVDSGAALRHDWIRLRRRCQDARAHYWRQFEATFPHKEGVATFCETYFDLMDENARNVGDLIVHRDRKTERRAVMECAPEHAVYVPLTLQFALQYRHVLEFREEPKIVVYRIRNPKVYDEEIRLEYGRAQWKAVDRQLDDAISLGESERRAEEARRRELDLMELIP